MSTKPVMVELFSGSGVVSSVFRSFGWDSISIDNNEKLNPSMCCNVLELRPAQLPQNVSFIWASPVCTCFSRASAQSNWKKSILKYRQYHYEPITQKSKESIQLLEKTIEIINSFPGVLFVIENPIGRIQHIAAMKSLGHYRYAINYADFGFSYSKETYLFTNFQLPFSIKKVHSSKPGLRTINGSYSRSVVPAQLVEFILKHLPQT